MTFIKWTVFCFLALSVTAVSAEERADTAANFQKDKEHRIQMMEKGLACLKAANSRKEMAACHEAAQKERNQMKREKIQEQLKKLDEQDKKLSEGHE
ncbi:MAG: hypothetical protein HQL07_16755 [Nitrospirae bacterium]|nr:hypothetical protein [Magnetococcales bacterium]HAT49779.1 hypothetical protein [Alphaproteobacteria bacterium]